MPVERTASEWNERIGEYTRKFAPWRETADRIVNRYRADTAVGGASVGGDNKRIFNVLWANVQIQKPAMFSQNPSVVAERRHKDPDPVARTASEVIERALGVEMEGNGLKDSVNQAVLDMLLVGRGTVWCQFDADIIPNAPVEPVLDDFGRVLGFLGGDGMNVDPAAVAPGADGTWLIPGGAANEQVRVDYVDYRDFAHSPDPDWKTVMRRGWVARRQHMTPLEVVERFGPRFNDVKTTHRDTGSRDERQRTDLAEVWEVWDAVSRKRIFVAKDDDRILESEDDPYGLSGFFPCPRPVYATLSNGSLVPIPDFVQYEGLADELERISQRIRGLQRQLRVLGVYKQSAPTLGTLFTGDDDAKLEPVPDGQLTEGNGLRDAMDFVPLGPIREALVSAIEAREQTSQKLYEVSGISDIMRGSVDPREKASQSKLKAGYGSQRLNQRREGVEVMVRDVIRTTAEMTVELFRPELLRELSGFDYLPKIVELDQQTRNRDWQQVVSLLNNDELRKYRIDIETGSTVELESQIVKEQMTEYMTAVGGFLNSMMPLVTADPSFGPVAGDLLLALSRKYNIGRTVEVEIESYVDKLRERADAAEQAELAVQQQPQPQPGGYPAPVPEQPFAGVV